MSTEIMGLSHREREEVANIVLYNTQELPDTDELDTAFWREEYLRIAKLSSILRLANALDRGHKQKLEKCSMARKGKELIIPWQGRSPFCRSRQCLFHDSCG